MADYISIKNKLYPFKFHIFLNINSVEEIGDYVKLRLRKDKELFKSELQSISSSIKDEGFVYEYSGHIIVVCKKFDDTPKCWDTLTHELTHAVFRAASYIGIKPSEDSEEFFSYMMGHLVNHIISYLRKRNKVK